jgi:hypothetical protein
MFFINENREAWYKKIGMYPKAYTCSGCGKDVFVEIPFLSADMIGLCSVVCCTEEFQIYRGRPRSPSIQLMMNEAFAGLN